MSSQLQRDVQIGATLRVDGYELTVVNRLLTTADHGQWTEYEVTGHSSVKWITVGAKYRGKDIVAWTDRPDLLSRVDGAPGADELVLEGRPFERFERGVGHYSVDDSGRPVKGAYRYVDYLDHDEVLSFFRYDDDPWLVATGRVLRDDQLVVELDRV